MAHDFFDAMAAEAAVKTQLARFSMVLSGRTAAGVIAGAGAAATNTMLMLYKKHRQAFTPTILASGGE